MNHSPSCQMLAENRCFMAKSYHSERFSAQPDLNLQHLSPKPDSFHSAFIMLTSDRRLLIAVSFLLITLLFLYRGGQPNIAALDVDELLLLPLSCSDLFRRLKSTGTERTRS